MSTTKCLMCQKHCISRDFIYELVSVPQDEKNVNSEESGDCNYVYKQLQVIFLLRKVLDMPEDLCCRLLKNYGDPCLWGSCCAPCSGLVKNAKDLFDQLELIKKKFQNLQGHIKGEIIKSRNCDDTEPDEVKCGAKEIIRTFICQEKVGDPVESRAEVKLEDFSFNYDSSPKSPESNDPLNIGNEDFTDPMTITSDEFGSGKADNNSNEIQDILRRTNKKSFSTNKRLICTERKRPHSCNICEKKFTTIFVLKRHQQSHEAKPNSCRFCGKVYTKYNSLKVHEMSHGRPPSGCEICGKNFKHPKDLKIHLRMHSGEKLYECESCGKFFATSGILKIHVRIHSGDRPYCCKTCGKSFHRSGDLKAHIRIHTGEKPYKCNYCGKCFTMSGGLKDHLKIHTGERPFCCDFCGKSFAISSSLKRHKRVHVGEKPYEIQS